MGRPKMDIDKVKSKQVRVRITDSERKMLEARAKDLGVTISEILKMGIYGYVPPFDKKRDYTISQKVGTVVIRMDQIQYGPDKYMYNICEKSHGLHGDEYIMMRNDIGDLLAVTEDDYYNMTTDYVVTSSITNEKRMACMFEQAATIIL